MDNQLSKQTPPPAEPLRAEGALLPSILRRIEWLCLLNALILVVLVYPLRLKDAWLGALLETMRAWPAPWGDLATAQLEPILGYLHSPLVLKGCLASIMLVAFIGVSMARRLLEPLDSTGKKPSGGASPLAWVSVLALFAWIIFSLFWSPTPLLARYVALWAAVWGLSFYLLLRRGLSLCEIKQVTLLLVIMGSLVIAVLYLQALPIFGGRIFDFLIRFEDKRNLYGSLLGHNTAAASFLLLTAFPALAVLMTSARKWVCVYCGLYLAGLILALLLLQSRAIWIFAPVLGLLALRSALRSVSARWARWLPTIVLAAGLLALLTQVIDRPWNPLYVSENPLSRRMGDLSPSGLMKESRLRLNWIGVRLVPDHPIVGHGLYAYQYVYPRYQGRYFLTNPDTPLVPTIKRSNMAHNEYLQLTIDHGLIGLALMLWVLYGVAAQGRRRRKRLAAKARLLHEAFGWSSLAFLLHACVDFPFHVPQLALPGMLCLTAWCAWREPEESATLATPSVTPRTPQSARAFRPGHFLRLLGALMALGAIPVVALPFGRALVADIYYKRGEGHIQYFYEFGSKLSPDARQDVLRAAIQHYTRVIAIQPHHLLAFMQMGDAYRLSAQMHFTAWSQSDGANDAGERQKHLEIAKASIENADQAMTLAGQRLNFHGVYIQHARIFELMNRIVPGKGYDRRYREALKLTMQYCPNYGWAANLLARELDKQPNADRDRIAQLRRVLYRYQPQDFHDTYIVPATDYLRSRLYGKAAAFYEDILRVDPENEAWLGATAYAWFMAGEWQRSRLLYERLNRLRPRAIYETGGSLGLIVMDGRWYDALVDMVHIPAQAPDLRAEMRALEIELQLRCPERDLLYVTFYERPDGMDEAQWQARIDENRPWALLHYLRDAQAARRAFDQRLTLEVPPDRNFWVTGVQIGLALEDPAMARRCLDEVKALQDGDFVVRELEKMIKIN